MKKKVIPAIIIIVLIFVFAGVFALQQFMKRYSYSTEKADLDSYFGVTSPTDVPIILGNEFIEEHAMILDGYYYMDFDSVQKYLNDRFYDGDMDNLFIYTTPTTIITSEIGSNTWTDTDGGSGTENYAITRLEGGVLYVALDYVKKFTNFSYEGFTDANHMQLTSSWEDETVATITKNTQVRLRGGVKSEILREIEKGETVVVLEQLENWSKVKTNDAYIGWVENKRLSDTKSRSPIPVTDYVEPEYTGISRDHIINLGFHNIGGPAGNDTITEVISGAKSLNVIAPTWFAVTGNDGSIRSYASTSYVNTAHNKGIEVWALLDNFTGGSEVSTSEVLNHAESRANLIRNVVSACTDAGVDGLNLDFEMVAAEDGQSYVELVREMSIACRKAGLVFSIDNYVPMNFNDYYDLEEQGVVADYVIIMGYDEHYAGSQEAGSVASLSYVENGIINTLKEVDASKVINAVPFYTRIWHVQSGQVSSEAVSMKVAKEYIANHSIDMQWNSDAGQNYGEYTGNDGVTHQIWMEDAESIGQKIDSMKASGIAGIAEWSLGMETSDIWDTIANYVNNG
ncbi:chitinase [Butyrivibrio sp. CB08]|uniref:glycosyl hydrolase family 18 protein n=1 Tax=Butyrivibrio sp. CB08 TaxID=2364879 RepID=UPI000EA929D3|nr:glycosyl hydrolase family 18 protein [Butyrivibrio sp. CB08]RKM56147.1 chitinase [Butyrivibrio sp. CB08]